MIRMENGRQQTGEARLKIVSPSPKGMKDAAARMIQAANDGKTSEVEAALQAGADVRARDDRGMDALSWAALRGHDAVPEGRR